MYEEHIRCIHSFVLTGKSKYWPPHFTVLTALETIILEHEWLYEMESGMFKIQDTISGTGMWMWMWMWKKGRRWCIKMKHVGRNILSECAEMMKNKFAQSINLWSNQCSRLANTCTKNIDNSVAKTNITSILYCHSRYFWQLAEKYVTLQKA